MIEISGIRLKGHRPGLKSVALFHSRSFALLDRSYFEDEFTRQIEAMGGAACRVDLHLHGRQESFPIVRIDKVTDRYLLAFVFPAGVEDEDMAKRELDARRRVPSGKPEHDRIAVPFHGIAFVTFTVRDWDAPEDRSFGFHMSR